MDWWLPITALATAGAMWAGVGLAVWTGSRDPARGVWWFFGIGGVLIALGQLNRNPVLVSAGIGLIGASTLLVWWGARRHQRSQRAAIDLGQDLGLHYVGRDTSPELATACLALEPGDPHARLPVTIDNVLSGRWHAVRVKVFDYWYEIDSGEATLTRSFVAALAEAPSLAHAMTIKPVTWSTKLWAKLGAGRAASDDESFGRAFTVRQLGADGTSRELDSETRRWLEQNARGLSILLERGIVLAMAKRGDRDQRSILETVVELRNRLAPGDTSGDAPDVVAAAESIEPRSSGTNAEFARKVTIGLAVAIVSPIVVFIAFGLLFYFGCVTGNGCL